jgi:hypothetical protein
VALKDATKDAAVGNMKGAALGLAGAAIVWFAIRAYEKAKGSK